MVDDGRGPDGDPSPGRTEGGTGQSIGEGVNDSDGGDAGVSRRSVLSLTGAALTGTVVPPSGIASASTGSTDGLTDDDTESASLPKGEWRPQVTRTHDRSRHAHHGEFVTRDMYRWGHISEETRENTREGLSAEFGELRNGTQGLAIHVHGWSEGPADATQEFDRVARQLKSRSRISFFGFSWDAPKWYDAALRGWKVGVTVAHHNGKRLASAMHKYRGNRIFLTAHGFGAIVVLSALRTIYKKDWQDEIDVDRIYLMAADVPSTTVMYPNDRSGGLGNYWRFYNTIYGEYEVSKAYGEEIENVPRVEPVNYISRNDEHLQWLFENEESPVPLGFQGVLDEDKPDQYPYGEFRNAPIRERNLTKYVDGHRGYFDTSKNNRMWHDIQRDLADRTQELPVPSGLYRFNDGKRRAVSFRDYEPHAFSSESDLGTEIYVRYDPADTRYYSETADEAEPLYRIAWQNDGTVEYLEGRRLDGDGNWDQNYPSLAEYKGRERSQLWRFLSTDYHLELPSLRYVVAQNVESGRVLSTRLSSKIGISLKFYSDGTGYPLEMIDSLDDASLIENCQRKLWELRYQGQNTDFENSMPF